MSTAYAAYGDALYVVDLNRESIVRKRSFDSRTQCVAVADDALLVGTFEDGLRRSTDDGASWTRAEGIEQDAVTALAVSPADPDTVYAGTEPSRCYRSTDGGDSWGRVGVTLPDRVHD